MPPDEHLQSMGAWGDPGKESPIKPRAAIFNSLARHIRVSHGTIVMTYLPEHVSRRPDSGWVKNEPGNEL